jgi:hypothetical protein
LIIGVGFVFEEEVSPDRKCADDESDDGEEQHAEISLV